MARTATTRRRSRTEKRGLATTWNAEGWTIVGGPRYQGSPATVERALGLPAYFACIRCIAEDVAKLPIRWFETAADGTRRPASNVPEPVRRLLRRPAFTLSKFDCFSAVMAGAVGWGNGFAEIVRATDGTPVALQPIESWRVAVERVNAARMAYKVAQPDGSRITLDAEDVLHVRGLSLDGRYGLSPVEVFRRSLAGLVGQQDYTEAFYANGAAPSVALVHPGRLSETAEANLRESWARRHGGARRAFGTAILQEGMTLQTFAVNPRDAQFIEGQELGLEDVCRIFRVPPHKIADLRRATFSNIEHQEQQYVNDTLLAWCMRLAEELEQKLLPAGSQLDAEHDFRALLRGDTPSRFGAYSQALAAGFMSVNEVRQLEQLEPVAGGDELLRPLNMAPQGAGGEEDEADDQEQEDEEATAAQPAGEESEPRSAALLPLLEATAARLLKLEANVVRQAAGDVERLERFRAEQGRRMVAELGPVLDAAAVVDGIETGSPEWERRRRAFRQAIEDAEAWSRSELRSGTTADQLLALVETRAAALAAAITRGTT